MNIDHNTPYFNMTIAACRAAGARGGRARARNLRLRKARPAAPAASARASALETAAEAVAVLDRQFPWLIGAERPHRAERNDGSGTRGVL
ncbi:MAG: hypothetical protein M1541_19475 [Acidobacteria bacterium]|nr:hypothetical protein [Acidobacteriota bacterium]